MIATWRKLVQAGVLGINRRNADYTLRVNPRHLYPLVDDKLQTKVLAEKFGISTPTLYATFKISRQVRDLATIVREYPDFVVKPAHGSGGSGILVIKDSTADGFQKINGELITPADLSHHILNILSGMYSLGGQPDHAMIEYRVQPDPTFKAISYQGVPDIRIILYLGVPVMAMVRLPTQQSSGKANLHQGAIGAGIDLSTGRTLHAVTGNRSIYAHPDTHNPIADVRIPNWDALLSLASRCNELTGLGYQGADFVLDRARGPLLLELNARPGLNIQIANHAGLIPRLQMIEAHIDALPTAEHRIQFAKQHFQARAGLAGQ